MSRTRHYIDPSFTLSCRKAAERGYAMLFVLLFIGVVGIMLLFYQLGNARNDRFQIYYAMGQEYAMVARAAHIYVQDHAYYTPYVDSNNSEQANRLAYYESVLTTKIEAYREPLGQQTVPGDNVITLNDLRQNGVGDGFLDAGMTFAAPLRGIQYTFRAHGGLLPMGAPEKIQAASSLLVMYGRPSGGNADIRTTADMAAFRAGAASNGLNRIGIVLPPSQRNNLSCRGQPSIVTWGSNDYDCLSSAEATAIGMSLDTFDVVAPAWESVEKQLSRDLVYRRPHPGMYGMNVMQQDLGMDGDGTKNRIVDAGEIYTGTVNIDKTAGAGTALQIGEAGVGGTPAALGDAILTVSKGINTKKDPDGVRVCTGNATTCFSQALKIDGDLVVGYKPDGDDPSDTTTAFPNGPDDPPLVKIDGAVLVSKGGVTVTADEAAFPEKGFFNVKGTNGISGKAKFNINKQDANGNGGTVINKKVTLKKFNVKDDTGTHNFVVDQDLVINGGAITIGNDATPAQVILTTADLKGANGQKIDIDTTGKGNNSGVFASTTEVSEFSQTGSDPMTFKNLQFAEGKDGQKPTLNVKGNVIIDPQVKHKDYDCIGRACPDQVKTDPTETPL